MKLPVEELLAALDRLYPDAGTALEFATPFQLLVAAILSAQCTDKQVNKITCRLFADYPGPEDLASLTPEQLAAQIKGCGLYRAKARHIAATCRILIDTYGGRVPDRMDDLLRLPGVGRKVAGVVLINAFRQAAMPVDTHVFRVANRLGLTAAANPSQSEEQLKMLVPPARWARLHHQLISHGRTICRSRRPGCGSCGLQLYCAYNRGQKRENIAGGA